MSIIAITIAYLAIITCLSILIKPKVLHKLVEFFYIGNRLYVACYIRIAFGILLLFLAAQSKLWWYVVTISLLLIASGVCVFFFGLSRTKNLFTRIEKHSSLALRLYTSLAITLWAILIYSLLP